MQHFHIERRQCGLGRPLNNLTHTLKQLHLTLRDLVREYIKILGQHPGKREGIQGERLPDSGLCRLYTLEFLGYALLLS